MKKNNKNKISRHDLLNPREIGGYYLKRQKARKVVDRFFIGRQKEAFEKFYAENKRKIIDSLVAEGLNRRYAKSAFANQVYQRVMQKSAKNINEAMRAEIRTETFLSPEERNIENFLSGIKKDRYQYNKLKAALAKFGLTVYNVEWHYNGSTGTGQAYRGTFEKDGVAHSIIVIITTSPVKIYLGGDIFEKK